MSESYNQQIADIYNHEFKSHEVKLPFGSYGRPLLYQKKYIPEQKDALILDAGCGNGNYAQNLLNQGYNNVYGIDLFEEPQVNGLKYSKASLTELPYPDNFFDFIYSFSVIYYLKDTESGIREISRVLKPGKLLILTAHTHYSFPTLIRKIKRKFGQSKHLNQVQFHSATYYLKQLKRNGFEIIKTDGYLLSPGLYKVYLILRKLIQLLLRFDIGDQNKITKSKFIARIKSEIAYHLIIVARKKHA